MTSIERHELRYQRRKQARAEKRKACSAEYDNFEKVCSCNALLAAAKMSRKSIRWKASVQRYFMSYMKNILETRAKMLAGENVAMGFIEFDLIERGKKRHIKSVHFKERVVQRALCDNALVPVLSRSLIYDNGASLKGKGIAFAQTRLKEHLHRYYRKNGFNNDGYILLMDFSAYFDNIRHEPIYELLENSFEDKRIISLASNFIEPFGEKSVGIGSQVSQILAVCYRSPIDHFVKEVLREKFYACYMDDSYIISSSKDGLRHDLEEISILCEKLGIVLNKKKTQIVKLSHGFTYMKNNYYLTPKGRVIVKPCKENTARERRKLKKFRKMVDNGIMTLEQVVCSYNSHRGFKVDRFDCHRTVRSMDKLFHELFGYETKINTKERF